MVRSKGNFTIEELQDLVEQDGLGTTVAYGVAPEHIADKKLSALWAATQEGLLKIQDYLDERDKHDTAVQITPAKATARGKR